MKKKNLISFFILFTMLVSCGQNQTGDKNKENIEQVQVAENGGIKFHSDLKWEDVLKMAKKANKPIFIDCYTTW